MATATSRMMKRLTMPRMRSRPCQASTQSPTRTRVEEGWHRWQCTRTRTRTRAGQWRPVSLRFRLSWQFIQFFTGPAACNGNLSAHLLMRLALLCGLVGNVKLIYNFPASHFNFSCCQHASCLLYHFAFCIFSLPDSIPLVRTGRPPTKLIFPCPGWILQAISTV